MVWWRVIRVKTAQSCPTLWDPMDWLQSPWNSLGQNTGGGNPSLLQGIFPTQGSNPGLPHCRRILYQLSHKGSPRILEWVAYPFSSRSSWPRNWTRISYIAGGFFTTELSRKPNGRVLIYLFKTTHLTNHKLYSWVDFLFKTYLFHLAVLGVNCCM